MTKVRGSNIRLAEEFVRQRAGDEGWQRVLAALSPGDREIVTAAIAVGWYELPVQHHLFDALDRVVTARPGGDAIEAFAAFVAEHDLTKVQRMFLRLRSPALVLEKSGEYWSRFYDAGVWKVTRTPPRGARGELLDLPDRAPVFCRFLTAYIRSMFMLAGAKKPVTSHPRCVCRGAASCVFEGTWSDSPDEG